MRTIILDNGHGMDTRGKCSPIWPNGQWLEEWDFNRDMVFRISIRLQALNILYIVLVPEVMDMPLATRCNRANAIYAKDKSAILLSIHANAGGGTGFEVFTTPGTTKADALATRLIQQLQKDFPAIKMRTDTSDGDLDKEANFYILKHTNCPAILAENLFMDTWKDCELLLTDSFRDQLADSYVEFIRSIQNA